MSIAGMTYEGTLSADGNSLAGKLTMGANSMPMPLQRATRETAWELPKAPAVLAKDVPLEFVVSTIKPAPEPTFLPELIASALLTTRHTEPR